MSRFVVCGHTDLQITYDLPESISYFCVCGMHDIVWLYDDNSSLVCEVCEEAEDDCLCEVEVKL